ncbi:hypothetical protein [Catenuloplanes atrovinosus]|uniref:Uncharacterized protein n=1 Tax=Catenuloplanes atrovinosus TaxID=137266 RepID=A0AAE3YX89_9ACTN|nr:hypothetical protein [Catenuloplanes atrovinosus]MDR7280083.1 hypothetical protein [Catenuloplanes atrovinosus]
MFAVLRSTSQMVADRRVRRPGRAARWPGLRTLVLGGIAGAAWLLSAGAAHAAEPETPTDAAHRGPSVLSLVSDPGTGVVEERAPSLVGELLTPAAGITAALPTGHLLGTGAPARTDTAMPARQPAESDAPAHPLRTLVTGDGSVLGAVRELVAPLRLTGGPTGSADSAARDAVASPAGTAGRGGPDPTPGVAPSRPLGDLTRLVGTADTPAEPDGVGTDSAAVVANPAEPTPVTPNTGVTAASTAPARVPAAAVVTGPRLGSEPERAARPALDAESRPLREARPAVPEPLPGAPLPIGPAKGTSGGTSGVPTGGSGVHTDGGSSAVISAAVAGTMGAVSRPTAPADVVVPRCDAEAPTVSPD